MQLPLHSVLHWARTHLATSSLVVALSVACLIHWILHKFESYRRLPPGPWLNLPFLGFLPLLGSDFLGGFQKLQRRFGPIYRGIAKNKTLRLILLSRNDYHNRNKKQEKSKRRNRLRLGQRSVLMLSDFESVKDAFSQRAFLGRPPNPPNHLLQGATSFSVSNGIVWQEQKRFALHVLRDLGFGKTRMETHIKEEIGQLLEELESFEGRACNVRRYLAPSTSNNISALVFGRRLDYHDPMRLLLDKSITELIRFFRPTAVHAWFPWVKSVLYSFKLWDYDKLEEAIDKLMTFVEKEIDDHKTSLDQNSIRDYMDGFLLQMEQRQYKDPNTSFTRAMLKGNAPSLIGAGSTTVRATVEWTMLTMARYQDVQERIFSEIEEVVGRERTPQWADHTLMPYTEAVLMEVQRWKTVVPINLLRFTTEPSEVGGFYIPEGMTVIANIYAVHNDSKHWKQPKEFRPERFLSLDKKKVLKDEHWIPFSLGKRMCPGETLANVEIFLYATSLIQRFRIMFPPDNVHNFEGNIGATFEPKPYELCMIPRSY